MSVKRMNITGAVVNMRRHAVLLNRINPGIGQMVEAVCAAMENHAKGDDLAADFDPVKNYLAELGVSVEVVNAAMEDQPKKGKTGKGKA